MAGQRGNAGRSQRGSGERWRWTEVARGSVLSSTGAAVRGTWPAGAAAAWRREKHRRKGLEEEEGGLFCDFLKVQRPHEMYK
jgi:hypothetical protein